MILLSGWDSFNARYRAASVFRSRALAASSKMKISAGFNTALATEIRCFSAWPRLFPPGAPAAEIDMGKHAPGAFRVGETLPLFYAAVRIAL